MSPFVTQRLPAIWLISLVFTGSGCIGNIGKYDETAHRNAIAIKAESLDVMEKATGPYINNKAAVEALKRKVDTA